MLYISVVGMPSDFQSVFRPSRWADLCAGVLSLPTNGRLMVVTWHVADIGVFSRVIWDECLSRFFPPSPSLYLIFPPSASLYLIVPPSLSLSLPHLPSISSSLAILFYTPLPSSMSISLHLTHLIRVV